MSLEPMDLGAFDTTFEDKMNQLFGEQSPLTLDRYLNIFKELNERYPEELEQNCSTLWWFNRLVHQYEGTLLYSKECRIKLLTIFDASVIFPYDFRFDILKYVETESDWMRLSLENLVAAVTNSLPDGEQQIGYWPNFEKIDDAADMFYDAMENVSEQVSSIGPAISGLLSRAADLTADGQEFLSSVKEKYLENCDSELTFIRKLKENWPIIMVNIYAVSKATSLREIGIALLNIAANLGVVNKIKDKILDYVSAREGEQQGFDNTKKFAALAITMLTKFSPNTFVSSFTGKLNTTTKDIKALDELMEMLNDTLAEWGFDVSSKAKTVRDLQEVLRNAIEKEAYFRSLLITKPTSFNDSKIFKDFNENLASVKRVQMTLNQSTFKMLKDTSFVAAVNQLRVSYDKMYNRILEVKAAAGSRVQPACFVAVGQPGVGKTVWLSEVLPALKKRFSEKFADDDKFARLDDIETWSQWDQTVTDNYHQGYTGQEVHIANELFQAADDSDHPDFLRFISNDTFLTVQAALDDKGKPYEAKLYIGSANTIPKSSKTINSPQALWRRMRILYLTLDSPQAYKKLDPDDLTLIEEDCRLDTKFNHLQFRILTVPQYFDIIKGVIPTEASARLRTHEEVLDFMIRDMWINDCQFQTSSAKRQQADERPYNDENKLFFAEDLMDVVNILKEIPDKNRQFTYYRQFRRLRLGEENLPLADFCSQGTAYRDFHVGVPLLQNLTIPTLPDDVTILMRSGLDVWAWEKGEIFETSCDSDDWQGVFKATIKDDDPVEKYTQDVFGRVGKYVYNMYASFSWLSPLFQGASILGSFVRPLALGAPATLLNIAVAVLLYYLYAPEDGAIECVPAIKFWSVMWNSAIGTVSVMFLGYLLYQLISSWLKVTPITICVKCTESLEEGITSMQEMCDMSCGSEHSDRCKIRQMASRQYCTGCDEGLCDTVCLHHIEVPEGDQQIYQQEIDRLNNFQREASPKKFSTRKTKMRMESSPKTQMTRKAKMRIGSMEYKFGAHQPGDQSKKEVKIRLGDQEMVSDPNALDLALSLGNNLSVQIVRMKEINGRFEPTGGLFGTGCGTQVVSPAHIHLSSDPSLRYFAIRKLENGDEESIELKLRCKKDRRDIAIWDFANMKQRPFNSKLRSHLLTREEMTHQMTKDRLAILYIPTKRVINMVNIAYRSHDRFRQRGDLIMYDSVFCVQGISCTAPFTERGDCGGLLIAHDSTLSKKILGMHVVGTQTDALSTILVLDELVEMGLGVVGDQEDGEPILSDSSELVIQQSVSQYPLVDHMGLIKEEAITELGKRPYLAPGDFTYIGEIDMHKPASASTLRKSPLYGTFPETSIPAITQEKFLVDTDGLVENGYGHPDLLLTQVAKYGNTFKPLEQPELLSEFVEELSTYFADEMMNDDLGLSSEYDILNGAIDDEASHPLDMKTSAGVPWMNVGEGKGKKKVNYCRKVLTNGVHGLREHYEFNDKEHTQKLKIAIQSCEEHAKNNRRTVSISKDCLKDEARELGKANRPRAFKSFPLEKLYLFRKYFLKFKTEWTKRRELFFHGVGVDVMSPQWAKLHDYLAEVSTVGCDADFSTFDGNLRADFMDASNQIIIETIRKVKLDQGDELDPEEERVMRVLLDEIVRTVSVSKTTVYMDTHGNPSGSPLTTVTNCIVNFLYHWYCFARITGHSGLSEFRQQVAILCFGDDVIQTFSENSQYSFESVQRIMVNELGQKYTTAAKGQVGTTKPLSELTFLKRKFVRKDGSPNIILSPIEPDSIYQRFNWTHLKFEETEGHINVIEESLVEAAQHGKEFYADFIVKLKNGIRNLKKNQDFSTGARINAANKFTRALVSYSVALTTLLARY